MLKNSIENGITVTVKFDYFHSSISRMGHRKRSTSSIELRHSRSSSSLSNGKLSLYSDEVFKLTPFIREGLHTGIYMK